ncbi:septum formation inhibitor MinC [Aquibium carbonis]|uniref:Probable septum site-determining protein MinC n=1 Tax=Aquibium carbonis TaxID=2495581 RepID=A0A429YXW1_9HYPH|nr:septum site-determining protein MinC [Aquibium carbonis]RST86294.1 septum formation inhibitor MinC [Aquibium carbonis]
MTSAAPIDKKAIRFRARSFVAFALAPEAPLGEWIEGLDRWIENSPGFFTGRPVVLDLGALKPAADDVAGLVAALAARNIRVYAIEGMEAEAATIDLPPLLTGAREATLDGLLARGAAPTAEAAPVADIKPVVARSGQTLTIDTPVRSGSSIVHMEGDVIVLGDVAWGSEIVASGSIHVYGALRGRALAGADGNDKARIFCRRNEAELMAVNGWYRTAEDMEPGHRGAAVQACLDGGALVIAPLK